MLCANLEVPLDYQDRNGAVTNIFFAKLLGNGNQNTAQDIIFNPGGPGSSGVDYILSGGGDSILEKFAGNYNLVGFDPRGVNNSAQYGPLSCFPSPEARDEDSAVDRTSLETIYTDTFAKGQNCSNYNNNNPTRTRFSGTMAVVQDILYFHELYTSTRMNRNPKTEPIWYYGISYGTVIGQTLAAMYPSRVGRIIVDGNVNGAQHYTGYVPSDVDDADKTYQYFFKYCLEAGQLCPFNKGSRTVAEIETRFRNLLQRLDAQPLQIPSSDPTEAPSTITKSGFLSTSYQAFYGPKSGFNSVAKLAASYEQTYLNAAQQPQLSPRQVSELPDGNYDDAESGEVLTLVTCVDGWDRYPLTTFEEYNKAFINMTQVSFYGGENAVKSNVVMCAGMNIAPPPSQRFPGFTLGTVTANPVLFVNTMGDPITPVSSAKYMSQFFQNSGVLLEDTPGHGYGGIKSTCTDQFVQTYLRTGKVPPPGTICPPDR
ncbi:hypothetical protein EJ04DRAFT_464675, partial [Polyplosphaeria fusca]